MKNHQLPLLVAFLLLLSAAPILAQSAPLVEFLPQSPEVAPAEALARSGAWAHLKTSAQQLFLDKAPNLKTDPASVAAAFALLALADVGSGDPGGGICRWQAAQFLDPRLRQADLSAYGEPGRLLQANPVRDDVSAHEMEKGPDPGAKPASGAKKDQVKPPKAKHRRAPEYTALARKARIHGIADVKAIIAESGRITQPQIVKAPPLGLGATTLDAVCDWSFEPATFEGKPVKVYFGVTITFNVDSTPAVK
jgi:TonB family protein